MAAVQPIPDDEIAAELAASWDPDDGPAPIDPGRSAVPARPWRPSGPQDLAQVVERTRPVSLRHEQGLPVVGALAELLPAGLPRGSVVAVGGGSVERRGAGGSVERRGAEGSAGATSLALVLAAAPVAAGSWVAVVGLPAVGLAAAAELGVGLERVVVVQAPPADRWATAVGALVGAFDLVLVASPPRVRAAEGRRLAARARERGTVLVDVGVAGAGAGVGGDPILRASIRLRVIRQRWFGVGDGHGHLQRRWARVELDGRRHAARPRQVDLWLPDDAGEVRAVRLDERIEEGIDGFEGASDLTSPGGSGSPIGGATVHEVRRQRIRRVARRSLPAPVGLDGSVGFDDLDDLDGLDSLGGVG